MRQIKPTRDPRRHIADRERTRDDFAIGGEANEAQQRRPGEPYPLGARQARVPPLASLCVNRRLGVMRVNEDVDVGQDRAALAVPFGEAWMRSAGPPRTPPPQARRPIG